MCYIVLLSCWKWYYRGQTIDANNGSGDFCPFSCEKQIPVLGEQLPSSFQTLYQLWHHWTAGLPGVCSVRYITCFYFWDDVLIALEEYGNLMQRLRPGGVVYVDWASYAFYIISMMFCSDPDFRCLFLDRLDRAFDTPQPLPAISSLSP